MKLSYDKAIVGAVIAIIGSGISTAIALGVDGQLGIILTILAAMLTTAGTYAGVAQADNKITGDGIKLSVTEAAKRYVASVEYGLTAPPVDGEAFDEPRHSL